MNTLWPNYLQLKNKNKNKLFFSTFRFILTKSNSQITKYSHQPDTLSKSAFTYVYKDHIQILQNDIYKNSSF